MTDKTAIINSITSGWKARYRLWALDDGQKIVRDLQVGLPEDDIFDMLLMSFHGMKLGELNIPVSFSHDLETFSILHSVIRTSTHTCKLQKVDSPLLGKAQELVRHRAHLLQSTQLDLTDHIWYHASFSPNGVFLAVVRSGPVLHGEILSEDCVEYMDCSIAIFEDRSSGEDAPDYQLIATLGPLEELGGVSKPLAFHTSQPILAIIHCGSTYIWQFADEPALVLSSNESLRATVKNLLKIYDKPLDDITFSPCGRYLFGNHHSDCTAPIKIDLDAMRPQEHAKGLANSISSSAVSIRSQGANGYAYSTKAPKAQSPNEVIITAANGLSHRSTVKQYHKQGAVVLESIDQDGTLQCAELLRIPRSVCSGGSGGSYTTLLNPFDDSKMIHMVLNKATQETYNFFNRRGLMLPLVVERNKDTIAVFTYQRQLCGTDGEDGQNR